MDSLHTHSRRAVLGAGIAVAGGGLLAASAGSSGASTAPESRPEQDRASSGRYVDPHGPEVADAESRRASSGRVRRLYLEARRERIDIGGRTVPTWVYGDRLPGDVVRVTAGDTLSVVLANSLPQSTTVHWHGLDLRNDMDGVPDVTQRMVQPGSSFHYRFRVTRPGTYWMHPHVGVQQDHGLYAPLIVDDPREPLEYDHEWVVVLDDWLDGVDGSNPDAVLDELNHGRGAMHGGNGSGHDGHGSGHDGNSSGSGHGSGAGHTRKDTDGRTSSHESHSSSHSSSHAAAHGTGRHHEPVSHGGQGRFDGGATDAGPAGRPGLPPLLDGLVPHVNRPALDGLGLGLGLANSGLNSAGLGSVPPHGMTASAATSASAGAASMATARASRSARRDDGTGHGKHGRSGPSRLLPSGSRSSVLGGMPGNVNYPYHLINGRTKWDPETFRCRPGDRVRIRFINAGGDTAYRVALGGHRMTVTHTDGNPVEHVRAEQLLIGMAERYDVMVTARSGVFPLVAVADGKGRNKTALAVLRTAGGRTGDPSVHPRELDGPLMTAERLRAHESVRARRRQPDRILTMKLTGTMAKFDWAINGRPYTPSQRYPIRGGERVRLVFRNDTDMWHPMHLHGHSFWLPDGGPRKDTTVMQPGQRLAVEFDADNPGLWMLHCHNVYHSESGMMTILGYLRD
ncbi:multicopper oxidase family protein [Streptomyces sp. BHT-5-2]|uniref:multicopper oxidase family protein n=1 Tax=Streptomyces sp. BHT-5-2 TaxID=2866715 RepID=UPI001C8D292F|nr:multicopper oxidase family protein [Streptomyces sp. BHT-5-2]QZL06337.1 multicopper oxidase family protein [Streptomyces sp. BHT-5-2]